MSLSDIIKYVLEGLAVALAAFFIPQKKSNPTEIFSIALAASATFMLLDLLAPSVSSGARQGAGLGVGLNQVGFQLGGYEENSTDNSDKTSNDGTNAAWGNLAQLANNLGIPVNTPSN